MGNLMREYWMPAMMSTELPSPDCAPLRVRLLGENLIAFRTTSGDVGVVADACPHRGASLFFGRNEEEGLRCVYHGWKFDVTGACVDMPSEPAESNFRAKVKARAYPTRERCGLIWVYMGPREVPPPLPDLEANMLPEGEYTLGAYSSECNWLQSLEGDYDTIHWSFLHMGSVAPEEYPAGSNESYALGTRWARFITADTEFGCSYGCHRPAEEDTTYWRIAHFLFPFYAMVPTPKLGDQKMFIAVVPIDDENCLRFHMNSRPQGSGVDRARVGYIAEVNGVTTGYHEDPRHNTTGWLGRFQLNGNVRNDYLIDRETQRLNKGPLGYCGIPGRGQDGAVTESMGTIYQRDQEHLGVTDSGIIRMRRLFIKHVKALRDNGTTPPGVDNPGVYKVRSGGIVLPNGVPGLEATQDLQWKALQEERAPAIHAS
jgi:phenylpropionate dioxygenase-like ring-hydroxylating dioxygenase large terminal subunit